MSRFSNTLTLHRWRVVDARGELHDIEAHYAFNNDDEGRGLVFRRHEDDDHENRTRIVASFATGHWASYSELT